MIREIALNLTAIMLGVVVGFAIGLETARECLRKLLQSGKLRLG